MIPNTLPCVKCGASLPISTGSTVQCFACGTTNGFSESMEILNDIMLDLVGYNGDFSDINQDLDLDAIHKRMLAIDKKFNEILTQSRRIDYLIVTKLDDVEFETNLQEICRIFGVLAIVIESFLIPILDNDLQIQQYNEIKALLNIRNMQLIGLIQTIEAKDEFEPEKINNIYQSARNNFKQAKELASNYAKEYHTDFKIEETLSDASEKFIDLLIDFNKNNPAYYADELEELESILKDLTDSRAICLKKQVIKFYRIGTSMMFILEEMRQKEKFKPLGIKYERIPFYTQEITEDFVAAQKWMIEIEKKFKDYQKDLMNVHSGRITNYLDGLRKDFQRRHNEAKDELDKIILQYVSTTLSDFAIEIDDDFELIALIAEDKNYNPMEIVDRFENIRFNMQALEETIKKFLFNLLDMAYDSDLKNLQIKDIVEAISERHAAFDKHVLNFINEYIEKFIEIRDSKRLKIEDQKKVFNEEYLKIIQELVDISYTMEIENIPLPLFMELVIISTTLEVDSDNRIVLLLENPSSIFLNGVGVTFFVPNTFKIARRIVKVGKLKPYEKKTIDSEFSPTEEGKFRLMALVNYNHVNDTFWMPSIQIPLIVGNPDKQMEKLNELYKKYGIEPERIEEIKKLDDSLPDEYYDDEFLEKYPHLVKMSDGTVEKDRLIEVLREVEDIESEVQEDSYYEDEPYKDMKTEEIERLLGDKESTEENPKDDTRKE